VFIRVHPCFIQSFAMIDLRNSSLRIKYFAAPFLIFSIILLWNQWRVSGPDSALRTAREYLEANFPGSNWKLGKFALGGQGFGKKWRLEFSSLQKDGRRIQANLLVDRWMPERIVGRFVLVLSPPQIVDGEWNNPTFLERLFSKVSHEFFFAVVLLFLVVQIFWLYRVHGRGLFRKADGAILAVLGGVLMVIFTVLEVHPGFMIAYPLIFTFLGMAAGSTGEKANGRHQE
jgi:cbb3-type cytochrome oxidase subunit 3